MKWKRTRVLVTGGAGFLGTNLVRTLLLNGAEVSVIDNLSTGKLENVPCDSIEFHKLDMTDPADMEQFTSETESFDVCYHLGSPCSVIQYQEKDPLHVLFNQVRGMDYAIKVCIALETPILIYPSSGNIYGKVSPPQKETDIPMPTNFYALGKYTSECMALGYCDPFFTTVGLRIFLGYGPFEEHKKNLASVAYQFLNNMRNEMNPVIYGDGKQTRDFIYVEDIVKAFMASADLDETQIINVGTGVSTNFNELAKIINKVLGTNYETEYIEKPKQYVESTVANTTKMRDSLELEPISLEDGIRRFNNYLDGLESNNI